MVHQELCKICGGWSPAREGAGLAEMRLRSRAKVGRGSARVLGGVMDTRGMRGKNRSNIIAFYVWGD
jgi:hypothetical protein